MTDAVARPNTALAIADDQTEFNHDQVAVLQQLGLRGADRADLAVFFHQARRTGLDPFARQIYMIERQGKQTIQTGIDGFRLIARRTVEHTGESLGYEDTLWCGPEGVWTDAWLKAEPPAAAKVVVIRGGQRFSAVALFREYVATKRDGSPTSMWATKGALMLAKCAEALALRKAFPQDLSGLYTSDEMAQAENEATVDAPQQQAADVVPEPVERPAFDPTAEATANWNNAAALTNLRKWIAQQYPNRTPEQDAFLDSLDQRVQYLQTNPTPTNGAPQ